MGFGQTNIISSNKNDCEKMHCEIFFLFFLLFIQSEKHKGTRWRKNTFSVFFLSAKLNLTILPLCRSSFSCVTESIPMCLYSLNFTYCRGLCSFWGGIVQCLGGKYFWSINFHVIFKKWEASHMSFVHKYCLDFHIFYFVSKFNCFFTGEREWWNINASKS